MLQNLILAVAPDLGNYLVFLLSILAVNIILSVSLNVINGYCGLFSMGHAGFFAVGAYVSGAFTKWMIPDLVQSSPVLALVLCCLIGAAAAAVAGVVIGVPCLRLTGDYLAIATLGFSEIIRIVVINLEPVGGATGFSDIPPLAASLDSVLIPSLLSIYIINRIIRSSYGRCIIAIRDDEIAARSMGVNVVFFKVFSFVLAAMFAGLAGALYAHKLQFFGPKNFEFAITVQFLIMIVIGGLGTMRGAVIGAAVVTFIPELLRFVPKVIPMENPDKFTEMRTLIFAVLLIVMMLSQPKGIMGIWESLKRATSTKKKVAA